MPHRDGYIPGVPCWVDASEPDPEAAGDRVQGHRSRRQGDRPAVRRPWSTPSYTIRITVLGDPQGATFSASRFVPKT
jgi:hypothetical protein